MDNSETILIDLPPEANRCQNLRDWGGYLHTQKRYSIL